MLMIILKRVLNACGYDVRRVPRESELDIAGPDADPLTFEYIPWRRGHVVFDVPVADARGFAGLGLPLDENTHPFTRAIKAALDADGAEARRLIVQSTLARYYEQVRPRSALDTVDLTVADAPELDAVPPFSHLLPWSPQNIAEITYGRQKSARLEGIQNGVFSDIHHGLTSFGPVAPAKLSLEVSRICKLLNSVQSRGFLPHQAESPLKVVALRGYDKYRWMIESGQHRFALAAALGVKSLPAMVLRVIRREDAAYWPQVRNGTFTVDGAEALFDRVFEGIPAAVCHGWISSQQRQQSFGAETAAAPMTSQLLAS